MGCNKIMDQGFFDYLITFKNRSNYHVIQANGDPEGLSYRGRVKEAGDLC